MLDEAKIRQVVGDGLSPVCATCTWYWRARDLQLSRCSDLHNGDCGGPIAGLDFPLYDGPMERLDKFCFACAAPASLAIKTPGTGRLVGVCKEHLSLIDRYLAEGTGPSLTEVRSAKGLVLPINGRYTRKSLVEVIAENEAKFEKERQERVHEVES